VGGILLGRDAGTIADRLGRPSVVVEPFPENRAGATSAQVPGVAVAPLVYVPLFEADTRLPFLVAAGLPTLLAVLVVPWFSRYR
jgi:hypothetical protein